MQRKILFVAILIAVVGVVYNEELQLASNQGFSGESDRTLGYVMAGIVAGGQVAGAVASFVKLFKAGVDKTKNPPDVKVDVEDAYKKIKDLGMYQMYILNLTPDPVSFYMYNVGLTRQAFEGLFKMSNGHVFHGKKVTIRKGQGSLFTYWQLAGNYQKEIKLYKDNRGISYNIRRGSVYVFEETGDKTCPYAMRELKDLTATYGRGTGTYDEATDAMQIYDPPEDGVEYTMKLPPYNVKVINGNTCETVGLGQQCNCNKNDGNDWYFDYDRGYLDDSNEVSKKKKGMLEKAKGWIKKKIGK